MPAASWQRLARLAGTLRRSAAREAAGTSTDRRHARARARHVSCLQLSLGCLADGAAPLSLAQLRALRAVCDDVDAELRRASAHLIVRPAHPGISLPQAEETS